MAELRLRGASTLAEANRVLVDLLPRFNARFGVPPCQPGSAYRPPEPGVCLEGVLCFKYQRSVARDNTVRLGGQTLQLLPGLQRPSYAQARVEVQERLDGSLVVSYQGQVISTREAPPQPVTLRARQGARGEAPAPTLSPLIGVSPNGVGGLVELAPDHEGARCKADKPPSPGRPGPHHPWRRQLLTKSLNS